MSVQGRRRGRPETRLCYCIADIRELKGLNTNMTGDRYRWKRVSKNREQVQRQVNKDDEEGMVWKDKRREEMRY